MKTLSYSCRCIVDNIIASGKGQRAANANGTDDLELSRSDNHERDQIYTVLLLWAVANRKK